MLSIKEHRKLLGEYGIGLSDQEVEEIRDAQYKMAEIAFKEWIKDRRAKKELMNQKQEASPEENEAIIRKMLNVSDLEKLSDWAGTSKWWRNKTSDINEFFKKADPDQLDKIRIALDEGYSVDEIIEFLK